MIESVLAVVGGFMLWVGVSAFLAWLGYRHEQYTISRRVRLAERRKRQG